MNVACNDVLWLILRAVPLNELAPLRLVCSRWNTIISKQCRAKKTLVLCSTQSGDRFQLQLLEPFVQIEKSAQPLAVNESDDLPDELTSPNVLFPNVSKLIIIDDFFKPKLRFATPSFVSFWKNNLTSLTIHGFASSGATLVLALNSLKSLSELHLLYVNDQIDLTKVTIIRQLASLSLVRYYGDIEPVLCQLGSKCTRLLLDKVQLTADQFTCAMRKNPQILHTLQHLSIGPLCVTERHDLQPVFTAICTKFHALTYLYADFAFQLSLREIVVQLIRLPRLAELRLTIDCDSLAKDDRLRACKPLRSVTKLHLNLLHSPITIDDFASTFARLFPALRQVKVRSNRRTFIRQLEHCMFGLFPQLHHCRLLSA